MRTYSLEIYKEIFSRIRVEVQANNEEEAKDQVRKEFGDDVEFVDIATY